MSEKKPTIEFKTDTGTKEIDPLEVVYLSRRAGGKVNVYHGGTFTQVTEPFLEVRDRILLHKQGRRK